MGEFESITLFLFFILIVLVLVPIVLLIKMFTMHHDLREWKSHLVELKQKVDSLSVQLTLNREKTNVNEKPEESLSEAVQAESDLILFEEEESFLPPPPPQAFEYEQREAVVPPPVPEHMLVTEAENATAAPVYAAEEVEDEKLIYVAPQTIAPPPPPSVKTPVVRKKSALEKFLTENTLSKIGVVTLVLGIGFFVKYAIDRNWINEIGRVGIGLLTGGLMIGIAHRLRTQFNVFSSILVGGGIAVFYITITLAFREYSLFSQPVAFALLIAVTAFSVVLSLLYNRKELAIFSLLGGFAAPLMVSTGTGNYVVLFSYLIILNSGMLILAFVKKWRVVGVISYVLTVVFFWSWLLSSYRNEYIGVALFVSLFFAQFYLLAIFDHLQSTCKITPYQVLLILTNNFSAFLAYLYVFDNYFFDLRGIITISLAVLNMIVVFVLFRKSQIDQNLLYLIIAVVLTFVSLAIPIQLNGHVITMFWAAEMVVLLLLWQKSRIKVFFVAFFVISFLLLISYVMDLGNNYFRYSTEILPVFANQMFITGLVVIAGFGLSIFRLKKEVPGSVVHFSRITLSLSIKGLIRSFKIVVILLAYLVPLLELNYQLERMFAYTYSQHFIYMILSIYTYVYAAVLCMIYYKNDKYVQVKYGLLLAAFFMYAVQYAFISVYARYDIYIREVLPLSYFLFHFISVPAIGFIGFYLVKKIKVQRIFSFRFMSWLMVCLSVAILTVGLDHILIAWFGNQTNYFGLLYDVHTFGYPILWGFLAMILMIWGLKKKEVVLRQISLVFFGVILVKFYAYDVWHMSQTGRIVSFVILGIILLTVSFLQQKIKVLVKNEKGLEEKSDEAI